MKTVCKTCPIWNRATNNYNLHIVLSLFFLEVQENRIENILEILDFNEYDMFKNKDSELQCLSLIGSVHSTNFEKRKHVNRYIYVV